MCKIWRLAVAAAMTCIILQVQRSSSCLIVGSVASCGFQNLRSVPDLPPNITHLFLDLNQIHQITASSLSHLPVLQQLDLGLQRAPLVIANNAFIKQTNLSRLVLGSNQNLHLEPLAFAGLSNLTLLDLSFCSLNETILSGSVLEPLTSLETLDLSGNNIKRLQPAAHFAIMTSLKDLILQLNPLDQICEEEFAVFQGKSFRHVNLKSVQLRAMSRHGFDWEKCGNPFKNMTFETLDLSSNMLSLHDLKQFLTATKGTNVGKLKVSGHYGKGFSFSNLPDPDNMTFEGLRDSHLQHLDLSSNRIFALQRGVFSPLQNVQIVDVSQNRVNQIHKNAFDGLEVNLQSLNLSHNLLGEIYSHTFDSLTSLRVLDLSHNHIGVLGYNSFSGVKNLRALFLTGNALTTLGFPAPLPKLQILKLDDNKLKSVYSIGQFATDARYLDVSNNRLTNLGDVYMFLSTFKHLEYLFFRNNPVEICVNDSHIGPNQLKFLHIDGIALESIWSKGQCLDLFHKLGHLQFLSLSDNNIRTLPFGVFKGLTAVLEINLSSNSLTTIQTGVIPPNLQKLNLAENFIAEPQPEIFRTLQFLDLRMNRFNCGPGLKNFVSWMKETNVTLMGSIEQLTCAFPSSLNGVSLVNLYPQEGKQ